MDIENINNIEPNLQPVHDELDNYISKLLIEHNVIKIKDNVYDGYILQFHLQTLREICRKVAFFNSQKTELKDEHISNIVSTFDHDILEKIRNSQSDAECRRIITLNLTNKIKNK